MSLVEATRPAADLASGPRAIGSTGKSNSREANSFHAEKQDDRREFLLASMRVAVLNLRTWQAELEMIGVALRNDAMSLDTACEWLDDIGMLRWMPAGTEIDGEVAA